MVCFNVSGRGVSSLLFMGQHVKTNLATGIAEVGVAAAARRGDLMTTHVRHVHFSSTHSHIKEMEHTRICILLILKISSTDFRNSFFSTALFSFSVLSN